MTGLAMLYNLAKQRDYATDAVGTFLNRAEGKTALEARWEWSRMGGVQRRGGRGDARRRNALQRRSRDADVEERDAGEAVHGHDSAGPNAGVALRQASGP